MAHTAHHHSSGFNSFLFGVLLTLVAIGGAYFWLNDRAAVVRTAALDRPAITIPIPRLPPPPGTIPKSESPIRAR